MSLTGFHPLYDMILSQNLQAVADQGCHLEGSSPHQGTAYKGYSADLLVECVPDGEILKREFDFAAQRGSSEYQRCLPIASIRHSFLTSILGTDLIHQSISISTRNNLFYPSPGVVRTS
jgi:hypothetical protein